MNETALDNDLYEELWSASARTWNTPAAEPSGRPRPSLISFTYGLPDAATFPSEELTGAASLVLREHAATALQYGSIHGSPRLIGTLIRKLKDDEGLDLAHEQVMITNGSSGALGQIARLLLDPDDYLVAEAPSFLGAVNIFRRAQAQIVEVPLDDEGIRIDVLEHALQSARANARRVKFIYVMPNYQNPTGVTLSFPRRHDLLDLAVEYRTLIVEDDAYHDIRFEGDALPSLFGIDALGDIRGHVIRTGTFSKILAAGLRLGWIIAPAPIIRKLTTFKDDGGTSPFASHVAAAYAEAGELGPHIEQLQQHYKRKRDAMLRAMRQHFPQGVSWTEPAGGFFLWVTLPEHLDASALLPLAREQGVEYLPGRACFASTSGSNNIRLAYSQPSLDDIEDGIKRLGRVLASVL
jgi:2-aminoadipate transaminase